MDPGGRGAPLRRRSADSRRRSRRRWGCTRPPL